MGFCCRLGDEYQLKKNILYESTNFFVVPSIGQMGIKGYVLLCSKEHYFGMGNIPEEQISELETVLDRVKKIISDTYNSEVLVFEHGPQLGCPKKEGCLDHGHLHVLPLSINIMDVLNRKFKPKKIKDLRILKKISKSQKSSYMFVETQDSKRYVIEIKSPLPSQYLRQVIALKIGVKEWNWRVNPDYENFDKTVKKLKDKF